MTDPVSETMMGSIIIFFLDTFQNIFGLRFIGAGKSAPEKFGALYFDFYFRFSRNRVIAIRNIRHGSDQRFDNYIDTIAETERDGPHGDDFFDH